MEYGVLVEFNPLHLLLNTFLKKHTFFQMGYANMAQRGHGLHLRQYARTFIVENNGKRVVFVNVDGAMVSHGVRRDVSQIIEKNIINCFLIFSDFFSFG